jgi:hypothetical protein
MSKPKILVHYIRYALRIIPLKSGILGLKQICEGKCLAIHTPIYPHLRPKIETTAIKLGENSNLSLEKISFSGFNKAVDMHSSNYVKAKKVEVTSCKTGFFVRASHKKMERKMALDLKNVKFKKGDVGVVAPDTYDIKARNVEFEEVKVGFDIYISKPEIIEMGMPENTPVELIAEAIQLIQNKKEKEAVENLSQSKLFSWLGLASNTVTIATPIVQALITYAASA